MKLGFRNKIYLSFLALLLLQGFVIFFWVSHTMEESMLEEIKTREISIARILSARMVEPLLAMDFLRMKVLVDETVKLDDDIFYTFVLDKNGNPLVHSFKHGFPSELKTANIVSDKQRGSMQIINTGKQLIYDYAVPVLINNDRLGTVRIGLLRTRAEQAVRRIMFSVIITIVLAILIAGIVGTMLLNPVTQSIKKLHTSSEQALKGNLDFRAAPMLKKNCWDIMLCHKRKCPAYKNYHHRCWYLAGTLCPTCVEGEYAKKIKSCKQCRVYKKCSGDEIQSLAESFDAMTLSLKGNLSDLKNIESVLNKQKFMLQMILDAIPDFISLQDNKGRYISVNRAFCEILNKTKEEVIGKLNDDLFSGINAELYNEEDMNVLKTGIPLIKENKVGDKKRIRWLHVVKIPIAETNDEIKWLVCSGRDITRLKTVQDQLIHAQKMESVGRLAAGVAHEINTPLGIILGYAQILLEDVKQKGQIYGDIAIIVKQTKACSRIVADLLRFSRSGTSIITDFDINEALEEVLGVLRHNFNLNHIALTREYAVSPLLMKGDKEKIKQVFINLLNNASDAIKENGSICIKTGTGMTENEIKISISDTGKGIPEKNIKKIFEPFYTTKDPDQGTGLGLSVTFGIIKEHKGIIKAFSPPLSGENKEHGTEFVVMLPSGLNIKKGELNG